MAPLVSSSLLLDVENRDNHAIAVGERGHIVKFDLAKEPADTTMRVHVKQVPVPTTATLTAITQIEQNYWAVGHDATILQSVNNGDSWSLVYSDVALDRPFLDILFLSPTEGIAVGAYGTFYRTIDGGKTWLPELHASVLSKEDIDYLDSIKNEPEFYQEELAYILPHFNRIRHANGRLMLAGEAGLLALSDDSGSSWQRMDMDYQGSFFDFAQISDNTQLAVGLRGNMFARIDNGNWFFLDTCVTTSLNAIISQDNGAFVVGNDGVILYIDTEQLNNVGRASHNSRTRHANDNCQPHIAVTRLPSNISSSIANGLVFNESLSLVTQEGIKKVVVTN